MSIYKSSAVLTNTTTNDIVVGSITVSAGSSITFWNTTDGVHQNVLDTFSNLRNIQGDIANLIDSGSLIAVHDNLTLNKDQFLLVIMAMANAIDTAKNLMELSSPINSPPVQEDGIPMIASAPRKGSDWVIGTHNFSDKCSWFQDSVRVTGEVLQNSGDGYTFNSANSIWLDMTSGRQHNEAFWIEKQMSDNPNNPHGYQVHIYVNGVEVAKRDPFETTGGDYEIIWESGKVVFFSNQHGNTITADYSYPTTSYFHVGTRDLGKKLIVEDAEANISLDAVLNDEIVYSWWVFDGYNWYELGSYSYARASQITTEARGAYPIFKAIGSSEADRALPLPEFRRKCRGMYSDCQSVSFSYITARQCPPGFELRLYTRHHRELGGDHVSITLYCSEEPAT